MPSQPPVVHIDSPIAKRNHSRFYFLALCGRRTTDFTTLNRLPAPMEDYNLATCQDCLRLAIATEQIAETRAAERGDAITLRLADVVREQRKARDSA